MAETKKVKTEPKKKVVKLPQRDEYIQLRSIVEGDVIYISRQTGLQTNWSEFGEVQEITFAELINMKSMDKYLKKPWLIVEQGYMEDDQYALVVKHLGLDKLYKDRMLLENIDEIFELEVAELESKLKELPVGIRESVGERALRKVADNELYDVRKINAIQRVLGIDLTI